MIRVTAKTDNPGVADRIGYVVISFANGEKAWVKIIQNGFPFSAGSIILNRATAGITGSTTFTLPSGCSATVVPGSYPAWFTPSVSVNGGTGTLTITSTSANLGDQRTATVDVMINSNPNYTYTITVTQPATGVSFFGDTSIDVNKAVGGKGDNITISKNVPSGISWEIISKPDFISVSPVSGVTDGKNDMKLTVAVTEANTSGSARTGEVIFRFTAPDGSTYDKIVTVTQSK